MENWAFSWNRIMGSALDKIKKKKSQNDCLEREKSEIQCKG